MAGQPLTLELLMDYRLDPVSFTAAMEALDRRRWLFEQLPVDPVHLEWFRHRAWVRTVHGTTKIEGNTLSDVEVEELLAGTYPRVNRKEALEILGSRDAILFVDDIALRTEVPIDEAVVRETHRRVLGDIDAMLTPGEYRRGENRVIGANGQTIFTTPPSGDVPERMRAFGAWLREGADGLPAPLAAAVAHLEFVAIHPFNDGNGRTARALARLLLARGDLGFGGLISLDGQLDHERDTYFAAIAQSTGRRYAPPYDATPFVEYFVGAAQRATDHALARMRGLGQVLLAVRRPIVSGHLPAPMLDGLAYAWINGSIRPSDYASVTGRDPAAATRDLGIASRLGYLEPHGATRTRRYTVAEGLSSLAPVPEA
jgi:Fic family protein